MKKGILQLFVLLLLVFSCKEKAKVEIKTEAVSFTKEGELNIFKGDSIAAQFAIEIAESAYETQTGLMYRESMQDEQAMLFIFSQEAVHSFYMKNTEFSIDIIFIDGNSKIATIHKNAQPYDESSLSSEVPIKYVLEVNAGLSDKFALIEGDSISFSRN
ncbi:MAG: DUF192 domain-containing protein [Allomuricauda sp.]|nr:MAG: DUF192 domain-containing protein [Allomuricauda sp.]